MKHRMKYPKNIGIRALGALVLLITGACSGGDDCRSIAGHWSNGEGQEFVLQPDGHALWLVRFGSTFDTVRMQYVFDCKKQPATLDLSNIQRGPYSGRTLYGIAEWTTDSTLRFRYETGADVSERPTLFDAESTQEWVLMR
jgi:hypothetical protein